MGAHVLATINRDGPVDEGLFTFASNGGNKNANGNYASSTKFSIAPASGVFVRIERLLVHIEDAAGMSAQEYGNLGGALTNGIIVQRAQDGVQAMDYTDGDPIKTNADWGKFCYDVDLKTWGAGNEVMQVRWTLSKAGTPVRLSGSDNDTFDIILEDDFSGLINHNFMVQGYIE